MGRRFGAFSPAWYYVHAVSELIDGIGFQAQSELCIVRHHEKRRCFQYQFDIVVVGISVSLCWLLVLCSGVDELVSFNQTSR